MISRNVSSRIICCVVKLFNPDPFETPYAPADLNVHYRKISNTLNHFRDRWKREYVINLREYHGVKFQNLNRLQMQLKEVVIVEKERQDQCG